VSAFATVAAIAAAAAKINTLRINLPFVYFLLLRRKGQVISLPFLMFI